MMKSRKIKMSPKIPSLTYRAMKLSTTITICTTMMTCITVLKVAAFGVLGCQGGPKHISNILYHIQNQSQLYTYPQITILQQKVSIKYTIAKQAEQQRVSFQSLNPKFLQGVAYNDYKLIQGTNIAAVKKKFKVYFLLSKQQDWRSQSYNHLKKSIYIISFNKILYPLQQNPIHQFDHIYNQTNRRAKAYYFCQQNALLLKQLISTDNDLFVTYVNIGKLTVLLNSLYLFPSSYFQITSMISQKGFYGMFSGVITTALLQPFENIKMALMLPPRELKPIHQANNVFQNTKTSCKYIYNADGIKGFYKGFIAATLKAALGCYIYFSGLRAFQTERMSASQNFTVSSLSRLASTFLTNPLNIIETRFQLAYFHGYTSIYSAAIDIYSKEGFKGFFIGGLSSCIKEGTFGGFHYMIYEEFKALGYHKLLSGIVSGMIATALTHPFQIIRARLQTQGISDKQENKEHRISFELKKLRQKGGWAKGLAPRLVKKPIANTLTFLIFQIMQDFQPKSKA